MNPIVGPIYGNKGLAEIAQRGLTGPVEVLLRQDDGSLLTEPLDPDDEG